MELLKVLMGRDGMSRLEAISEIHEMRSRVNDGEDPGEVLYDYGLEVDYGMINC